MVRAAKSGIHLTPHDAAIVKGMLARGDRQHDIAAWFGVNGGRIAEVSTGQTFPHVDAIKDGLPSPGPYLTGRRSTEALQQLKKIETDLSVMLKKVRATISDIT